MPGEEALSIILAAPQRRDGGRHLNIGRSGTGKSYLTLALLERIRPRVKWILTLDDKRDDHTPYTGVEYETTADFEAHPPEKDEHGRREHRIIFRGNKRAGVVCPAEDVAVLAQRFAQTGTRVCLNFDELKRAAAGKSGMHWTAPTVKWALTEGRSLGLWFVASTQSGKMVPEEALNEAGTISVFAQKRKAARYLTDVLDLEDDLAGTIPRLQEGEFVLLTDEEDWNGKVYKL